MSVLRTRFCGEVEFSDDAVIRVPFGLAPFVNQTRYLLLARNGMQPLMFLQSIEEPGLCFITMPATLAWPGYAIDLAPEHVMALSRAGCVTPDPAGLTWLVILTVPESGAVTANLMSPVVIDMEHRVGIQAVRADGRYSHAQPLGDPGGRSVQEPQCSY
jgi:flagellar assembly factor FliW